MYNSITKTCNICKRDLPAAPTHFHKDHKLKGGFKKKCKECMGLPFTTPKIVPPIGFKKCHYCGEIKPIDAFHKRATNPDGLMTKCKECRKPDYLLSPKEVAKSKAEFTRKHKMGLIRHHKHSDETRRYIGERRRMEYIKRNPPNNKIAINRVFGRYKKSSLSRGYEFELSKERFIQITQMNCFYCGTPPGKVQQGIAPGYEYIYNGIDRCDNDIGYTVDNSVPCCETCNRAKLTRNGGDFIQWVLRTAEHLKSKGF